MIAPAGTSLLSSRKGMRKGEEKGRYIAIVSIAPLPAMAEKYAR